MSKVNLVNEMRVIREYIDEAVHNEEFKDYAFRNLKRIAEAYYDGEIMLSEDEKEIQQDVLIEYAITRVMLANRRRNNLLTHTRDRFLQGRKIFEKLLINMVRDLGIVDKAKDPNDVLATMILDTVRLLIIMKVDDINDPLKSNNVYITELMIELQDNKDCYEIMNFLNIKRIYGTPIYTDYGYEKALVSVNK